MQLSDSIREIKGIGEKSEKLFAKLGISTVEELLFFYPREYEIVENIRPIDQVQEGHIVVVCGTLAAKPRMQYARQSEDCQYIFKGQHRSDRSDLV